MHLLHFRSLTRRRSPWATLLGSLILMVVLVGCGGSTPVSTPTPTATPSLLSETTFDLRLPAAAYTAPLVGPLPDSTSLHVGITFKMNKQLLAQLSQQKVLAWQGQDLEHLANQLGITDSQYQLIQAYFGVQHASLTLNKLHTWLTVDAQSRTFAQLFQVQFVQRKLNGRVFYAPTSNPKIPSVIVPLILSITGLDSYGQPAQIGSIAQHATRTSPHSRTHRAADCNPLQGTLTNTAIASTYGYDKLQQSGFDGTGITINLAEIDGFDPTDVNNYASCDNYHGQLNVKNVNTPPAPGSESPLDIEMIMGLAPGANIMDYQTADSTRLNDLLQAIINDNTNNTSRGSIVSISLHTGEAVAGSNFVAAVDQSLQILNNAEHMTVFVSSGDCAAFVDDRFGIRGVNFTASDPNVVAVGGTEPVGDVTSNPVSEQGWSDGSNKSACKNLWGSGGGLSTLFQQPTNLLPVPGLQNKFSNGMRQLPDVSAFAFDIAAFIGGQWISDGGTSAAAPIWAAGMALVNEDMIEQTGSFFNGPGIFYTIAANGANQNLLPFNDITQGNNLFFRATAGWDYATGLGTPNLPDFLQTLMAIAGK